MERNFIKFKDSDGIIQYYGITTIYRYEENFVYRYSAFRSQFFVKVLSVIQYRKNLGLSIVLSVIFL
jgi:hypothetical protein